MINENFSLLETKNAIMKIRDQVGYNSYENIHALMMKRSEENFTEVVNTLANKSLRSGKFPEESKKDQKVLIVKHNADDLNEDGAYRPVTLESLISKCIVTMVRTRLDWKLESTEELSETQEAYRIRREPNDLTVRMVQSIQESWNQDKTVIVFISDFKGFFESIWRPLLIIKLQRAGIGGDILKLINDYLTERKIRFDINSITTEWMTTDVGSPQGSGLSTILTNSYSSDNVEDDFDHGEFSDDNLKWEAHELEVEAARILQIRINEFGKWCDDNNIDASCTKTKIMVFRNKKCPRPYNKIRLTLNGEELEEVSCHKVVGTLLDNELSFVPHFEKVVKSGYAALNQVKRFCVNQKVPSLDTNVTLYKTLIRSVIDYSVAAVANINEKSLRDVISLERSCLINATRCFPQTDTNVLNLITNVLPIDLHFKMVAAKKFVQIQSNTNLINLKLSEWLEQSTHNRNGVVITTFCKMWMATKQILKGSHKDLKIHQTPTHDPVFPSFQKFSVVIENKCKGV